MTAVATISVPLLFDICHKDLADDGWDGRLFSRRAEVLVRIFAPLLILSSTDSTLASRDAVMWNGRIARYEDERTLLAPVTALFENHIRVWIFTT